MSVPITLTDNFVVDIIRRPEVQAVFPEFGAYAQQLKPTGKGCRTCGSKNNAVDAVVENARSFILSMPETQRQKLKDALKVPDRTFLAYRRTRNGPFERVEV